MSWIENSYNDYKIQQKILNFNDIDYNLSEYIILEIYFKSL
jgi:ATP-dependent exoDNAse (exonuclease V) beta subunit